LFSFWDCKNISIFGITKRNTKVFLFFFILLNNLCVQNGKSRSFFCNFTE